jgi:hypothetical protein
MYQRYLNAMYVHGNVRLAMYYRKFAKRSMVRTLDIRIDKLLARGHVDVLRWLIDGNKFERPVPALSLGEPQGAVDLTTFLFHALWRNDDKFPDKNILETLDVAILYLAVIKAPLTDESVKSSIRMLRMWEGMTLEGIQALFKRIPSLKSTLEPKTYDSVQESVLFAELTHIFHKESGSDRKAAEESLRITVFLLHHCPDREKRLAIYLSSIIVRGARPNVLYNHQLVSSGKGLAKVLTWLFQAISDGFTESYGAGHFCWSVFFGSPEFQEVNKRVIYPVSVENINKQYFNRMLASGPLWNNYARMTHLTLEEDDKGTFPEILAKSLRQEEVLSKYMTFVTHKFVELLSIIQVPLDPKNRVPLDDEDEGEPLQKRSRQ